MESPSGDNAVKVIEMTVKDQEQHTNLVDKASANFDRTDYNFERNSTVCQTALHATNKLFMKESINVGNFIVDLFQKLPQLTPK